MEKPEYSDLHKFYVSMGVVLIGLSFGFLWLFANIPINDIYYQNNLSKFVPIAQEIALIKLDTIVLISKVRWWFFAGILFSGFSLIYVGLQKWIPIQDMIDRSRQRKYEKDQLDEESIKVEIEYDLDSQLPRAFGGGGESELSIDEIKEARIKMREERIKEYKTTEMDYLIDLINIFPDYTPYMYYKINNQVFDLFLISKDKRQNDIGIDLRVTESGFYRETINTVIKKLRQKIFTLSSNTDKSPIGCLVLLDNSQYFPDEITDYIQELNNKYNSQNNYIIYQDGEVFKKFDDKLKRFIILNGINPTFTKGVG